MHAQTVGILGLNRTGTSLGMALKASPLELNIIGHDPYSGQARKAQDEYKAIDNGKWSVGKTAEAADILIIAGEAADQEKTLETIGNRVQDHTLILDLSGNKADGQAWAEKYLEQGYYIGCHIVLATDKLTDTRTGMDGADADLFRNGVFCLMPSADLDPEAIETAVSFGRLLGATPYFLEAAEFDQLIQGVQTVPGLLAAAMFHTIHNASSGRDMLRFAGQPFAQTVQPLEQRGDITNLAMRNSAATLRWLDAVIEELGAIRQWVANDDDELMNSYFAEMDVKREQWLQDRKKNQWDDDGEDEIKPPSIMQHLFGNLMGKNS